MDLTKIVQLVLLACLLISSYINGVKGGRRLLSEEDDIELEKQLELLNKPSVKSIKVIKLFIL